MSTKPVDVLHAMSEGVACLHLDERDVAAAELSRARDAVRELMEAMEQLTESDKQDRANGIQQYAKGSLMDKRWRNAREALAACQPALSLSNQPARGETK